MSELSSFQNIVGSWNLETFPTSTSEGHIAHMKKEMAELEEAVKQFGNGHDETMDDDIKRVAEESGDLFIMLLTIGYRLDFDLLDVAMVKFEELKKRKWQAPDENGVIEHVRTPEIPHAFTHTDPAGMPSDRAIMKGGI